MKITTRHSSSLVFLAALISTKAGLDFLSEYRVFNFVFITCLLFIGLPALLGLRFRTLWPAIIFALLIAHLAYLYFLTEDSIQALKFTSSILFGVACYSHLKKLSPMEVATLGRLYFRLVLLLFTINFAISTIVRSPLNRDFFAFEHANLLGSYLIFAFSITLLTDSRASKATRVLISTASFLTTSTGTFLVSILFWINPSHLKLRSFYKASIGLVVATLVLYLVSQAYFPIFFDKVFFPFEVIFSKDLLEIKDLALSQTSIQTFDSNRESSLLWRAYAYFIFWDYFSDGSFSQIIFGQGYSSYLRAWNGIATHNDFLLTLIDFGLLGFVWVSLLLILAIRNSRLIGGYAPAAVLIIVLRLLVENNIYSYYVGTNLALLFAFLFSQNARRASS